MPRRSGAGGRRRRRPVVYAVEDRTQDRIDRAVDEYKAASTRAQGFTAFSCSPSAASRPAWPTPVLIVGIWLGFAGDITAGTAPRLRVPRLAVRRAGADGHPDPHRRPERDRELASVIGIPRPRPTRRPGPDGGAAAPRRRRVVLRCAVLLPGAGRRCSVTSTSTSRPAAGLPWSARPARASRPSLLLTRLDGPDRGSRPARRGRPARDLPDLAAQQRGAGPAGGLPLRRHTVAANVRYGRPTRPDEEIPAAADDIGLGDWLAGLPRGSRRGSASAVSRCRRERQLVASGGPSPPTPTSSCSTRPPAPSTLPWRCASAGRLDRLMSGRTSVTIAHWLSTAEKRRRGGRGRQGPDREARTARRARAGGGSVYAGLHASWVAARRPDRPGILDAVTSSTPRSRTGRAPPRAWCPPSCSSTTPVRC